MRAYSICTYQDTTLNLNADRLSNDNTRGRGRHSNYRGSGGQRNHNRRGRRNNNGDEQYDNTTVEEPAPAYNNESEHKIHAINFIDSILTRIGGNSYGFSPRRRRRC